MSLHTSLYTNLKGTTAITDYVAQRIYPSDEVPQRTEFPYLTFECVSNVPFHLMVADADVYRPRYAFHIFANKVSDIEGIEIELKTALQDYRGTMSGTVIQRAFYENAYNGEYEPELDIHHRILDFIICHE